MLGIILALRFIYVSVTLQGHDGVIQALKGVFSTVVFLYVFDHFFPLYLDQISEYVMAPSKANFEYGNQNILMMGISYFVAFVATCLNTFNIILIGCLCLALAILLPFSYVLSSVLSLDVLTDIVKRLFTASMVWLVVNYIMHDYGDLRAPNPDDPSSYYTDLFIVSFLSVGGALSSGRVQQYARRSLEHVQSKYNEMRFEGRKAKVKDGLEKGKLATNAQGEAVKRGLALNPNLAAVQEYQAEKGPKEQKVKDALRSQKMHESLIGKPKKKKNAMVRSLNKVSKAGEGIKNKVVQKSVQASSSLSSVNKTRASNKVSTPKVTSSNVSSVQSPKIKKTPVKANTLPVSGVATVKPAKSSLQGATKKSQSSTIKLPPQ